MNMQTMIKVIETLVSSSRNNIMLKRQVQYYSKEVQFLFNIANKIWFSEKWVHTQQGK